MRDYVKLTERDNVAVVTHDTPKGTEIMPGLVLLNDIPQAHKFALNNIPKDGEIIRYGVVLGYALDPIKCGAWINEHMLRLPVSPSVDNLPYATNIKPKEALPEAPRKTFMGYRNPDGFYAGTRNILGIQTTVQCVQGVLDVAVAKIKSEILPKYPNVDDVVAVNHAYGCGVAINAPFAKFPIRALRNIARHPNFGGQLMVVALGCEKLTVDMLVDPENNTPENVIVLQDCKGYNAMIDAITGMAERKLQVLDRRRREELPLSDLLVGMQCGGSDAFSGVSANPSAGYAADMLVQAGATVMFSEVTEVRDGVQFIAERCVSEEVRNKLADEMRWYDSYLDAGNVDRSANPTPGNKKGGLSNIVEKAMGSIAKSGTSPIVEVLSPAERPTKHGMIYAATPASDMVCGPCQLASGIGLQVFMTGRGTPYGLAAAPVIKVCSRNEMKEQWPDVIDVSAGAVVTGEKTIAEVGTELFNFIVDVASGTKKPYTEQYGLHNFLCIFNPAPIT
ncbi:MAG: galactarate dehydratase [Synergistaceae bacterium]|nr:galactarate dehydratase [Synergistaceae bacterium]